MKKLRYFSKPSQTKLLIILSSTRLHYRVKEKGQTMDLLITTFKLKDIAIMQTHIIRQRIYHPEEYFRQQYFENLDLIISSIKCHFNQPAFRAFLKMEQLLLNIIHDKNYKDELAFVFNVYKDDIDPMQVRTEEVIACVCFK